MTSKPEIIDLTSSASSSSSSLSSGESNPWFHYFPQPYPRPNKSPFLSSSEDDSVVNPSESADDSDDSYKEGTSYSQPPTPRSQQRPRARNPPLPKDREVVLGLTAPSFGASTHIV